MVVGDVASLGMVWKVGRELRAASAVPVQRACLPRSVEGVENSFHVNFWTAGYPAVLLTDTAFYRNAHYHEPTDTHGTLDYGRMAALLPGLLQAVLSLAG